MTALNQAQASMMDAEQKLRNLGFGDAELAEILKTKDTRNLLNVVAPIDGTVVARHAVKGEAVQATAQLFAVADTSKMWLWIDVYESDIQKVKPGQAVSFTISGTTPDDGHATVGQVTWVGTEVNEQDPDDPRPGRGCNPNGQAQGESVRRGRDSNRLRAQGRRGPEGGRAAEGQRGRRLHPRGRRASTGRNG